MRPSQAYFNLPNREDERHPVQRCRTVPEKSPRRLLDHPNTDNHGVERRRQVRDYRERHDAEEHLQNN